ncbi:required for meiotic nuclear division protein 1 homolog [Caerostris extrusa]|uniref:Required for meiotic nuclear division protein 1 homolog n=1 Tax=Caerostris extrusa TaxID=172846 RepID=A0AAV4TCP6_CAEEX|nr:required for meiotic nuclear division protein 1 homolog [Caerostris extrusa]
MFAVCGPLGRILRLLQYFFKSMFGRKSKAVFSLCWNVFNLNAGRCQQLSSTTRNCLKRNCLDRYPYPLANKNYLLNDLKICKFHYGATLYNISEEARDIQKSGAALQVKKRVPRKKVVAGKDTIEKETGLAVAYCTAENYDMLKLTEGLDKQGLYERLQPLEGAEDVIHVNAKYKVGDEPRQIYFKVNICKCSRCNGVKGSVVFWNVPDLEQQNVLRFLKPFETNSYDLDLVNEEKEDLDYYYSEKGCKFSRGRIILNSVGSTDYYTYTFSNALALSVKLAIQEATLEKYVDKMELVTQKMKAGEELALSRNDVFKKRGQHVINLSSDLLDTPDFYWDRQELEHLYKQTFNHLNITKRTKVMNERLSYCSELIDLLSNHMNDKHHVRLEWMIIILIMVEVAIELIHAGVKVIVT